LRCYGVCWFFSMVAMVIFGCYRMIIFSLWDFLVITRPIFCDCEGEFWLTAQNRLISLSILVIYWFSLIFSHFESDNESFTLLWVILKDFLIFFWFCDISLLFLCFFSFFFPII
jgi:hypothetical protein